MFHDLMDYLMQQFPQCDDVMKIGEGKFTPHLSVAKFTSFKVVCRKIAFRLYLPRSPAPCIVGGVELLLLSHSPGSA